MERFARYGRELADAEVDEDQVIDVPSGFLGRQSTLPLWIRSSYLALEKQIEQMMAEEPRVSSSSKRRRRACWKPQFHVVGVPGIGKTYFGHYWLYKQAKLKRKVIWRMELDQPLYLYYDFSLMEEPFVGGFLEYRVPRGWETEISSSWMVIDGASKGVEHVGPILQCVAETKGYCGFSEDGGVVFTLDEWSLEELKACNELLELGFTAEELSRRFERFGGVPRKVLDERLRV